MHYEAAITSQPLTPNRRASRVAFPRLSLFSRESKYEIKGSKSASVCEKNVSYSNLKNAILKNNSLKMRRKKPIT